MPPWQTTRGHTRVLQRRVMRHGHGGEVLWPENGARQPGKEVHRERTGACRCRGQEKRSRRQRRCARRCRWQGSRAQGKRAQGKRAHRQRNCARRECWHSHGVSSDMNRGGHSTIGTEHETAELRHGDVSLVAASLEAGITAGTPRRSLGAWQWYCAIVMLAPSLNSLQQEYE